MVNQLHHVKIANFGVLLQELTQRLRIIEQMSQIFKPEYNKGIPSGVSINYLCLILISEQGSYSQVLSFLKGFDFSVFNYLDNLDEEVKRVVHLVETLN